MTAPTVTEALLRELRVIALRHASLAIEAKAFAFALRNGATVDATILEMHRLGLSAEPGIFHEIYSEWRRKDRAGIYRPAKRRRAA